MNRRFKSKFTLACFTLTLMGSAMSLHLDSGQSKSEILRSDISDIDRVHKTSAFSLSKITVPVESESTTIPARSRDGLDFTAIGGKRQGHEVPQSLRVKPGAKHPVWKTQSIVWLISTGKVKYIHPEKLRNAIHLSANYLINACDSDGKFVYRINLNPRIVPETKYNILRHAGTIYALAMHSEQYPAGKPQEALDRASQFLKNKTVHALPGRRDLLAVWSYPELTNKRGPIQAKLGGTALGLVALLSIEKIKPGTTSMNYLRKMGNFLVYMQKKDGSFYSKYIPAEDGRSDRWTSLYYPGEAALGLLMLYEADPSPFWLQAAADAMAHLALIRAEKANIEADHWALLATAKLLPVYHRCNPPLPPKAILGHAIQICNSILDDTEPIQKNSTADGCFTHDGRTTPTATRLEGLLAALTFLPAEHSALRARIKARTHKGMSFLLSSQVSNGKYAGAIPRGVHPLPKNHPRYTPSFNRRVTEVRIDYVQHALSSMIQYDQMFFAKSKAL
jgi:hypothetical protein